jgi:hypothetical protein
MQIAAPLHYGNRISRSEQIRGDVHFPGVYQEMIMPDELPGLAAGIGETEPVDRVVKSAFEQNKEVCAGNTLLAVSFFKIALELLFNQAVNSFDFLLFAKLEPVVGELAPVLAMLPRRVVAALDRAFVRIAAVALKI